MKNYSKLFLVIAGAFVVLSVLVPQQGYCQNQKDDDDKDQKESKKEFKPPLAPVVLAPPKTVDPAVADVKAELDEIIRIHNVLEKQQRSNVLEIQKIADQAKIHQKLLQQLDTVRRAESAKRRSGVEEVLRIEKIRQIQKTAEVNKAYLDKIREEEEAAKKKAEAARNKPAEASASVKPAKGPSLPKEEPQPKQKKKAWWE